MAIAGGDGSIVLTTKVDESGMNSGLTNLKKGVGAVGKSLIALGAAATTAFVGVTKAAVDSYAEYEQLAGGVETLFKDSADVLMSYADNAYETAGLSANDYMATVTSFSASLLQSLGGDTEKSAKYANQAIIDMSDNANKMGTSMEMIQNAYQGFAKQNYTMLDNLKLGYGGTKEEMQRLLDDAEKISGIEFDISSFADVTQAIHIMQTELGITGTTAKEASTTIQGSASAMKASWQNLLTGIADPTQDFETLVKNFISSIGTFANNLLPIIKTSTQGVFQLIQGLMPEVTRMLAEMLPIVIEGVSGIITSLSEALPQLVQTIISALPNIVQTIVDVLPTLIPTIINGIVQTIVILVSYLPQIIEPIINSLPMIISALINALLLNVPALIQGSIQLVAGIVQAIPQIIVALLQSMVLVATQVGQALFNALPQPIKDAFQAAFDVMKAVWDLVAPYFTTVWETIKSIFSVVQTVLGGFFETAWTSIKSIWDNVTAYFEAIWGTIEGIFSVVASVLKGNWEDAWTGIKGIVDTWAEYFKKVWSNIKKVFKSVKGWFKETFQSAWTAIKNVFSSWDTFFGNLWDTVKKKFTDFGSKMGDAIGGAVKSGINGVINLIESTINKAINLINGGINLINLIPGVSVGKVSNIYLPRLAQGAVIPGGREFLAVLGDQPKGQTNIETPLKTMIEAFNIALNQRAESSGDDQNIVVYLDSDVIFKTVIKKNRNYTIATGVNPLGV